MAICMNATFRLLRRAENGEYRPMVNGEATEISIGGFDFRCGEKDVSFDWDDFLCRENDGICEYNSLCGFMFVDPQQDISDLPTDDGLADVFAQAAQINDFFVYFELQGAKPACAGYIASNGLEDAPYRVELLSLHFTKGEGQKISVSEEVLTNYNKGIVKY